MPARIMLLLQCDVCKRPLEVSAGIVSGAFNFKADFQSIATADGKDPLTGWRLPQAGDKFDAPVLCPDHRGKP